MTTPTFTYDRCLRGFGITGEVERDIWDSLLEVSEAASSSARAGKKSKGVDYEAFVRAIEDEIMCVS